MPLIPFYLNQSPDTEKRLLSDIWHFSLEELEDCHDFIQWLFPLKTPSAFNPDAPLLTPQDIRDFHSSPQLQSNLLKSLDLMLHFYGLTRTDTSIARAPNFPIRSKNWLTPNNHNHLRLTRILTCLSLCGLQPHAASLLQTLLEIAKENPRAITPTTLNFWRNALNPV